MTGLEVKETKRHPLRSDSRTRKSFEHVSYYIRIRRKISDTTRYKKKKQKKGSAHSEPCVLPHAAVKESGDDQCCIEQSSNDNSITYLQDEDSFRY